ncbi:PH domain-containing protein DDB_G0287875 [Nematostella vectensis]|uniref:PH domain-containing protein DDB_G0287875 n=1 Tax=Nematostella vectensis TaxID=45351 RepID=UPI002077150C|nr:PH domain-containing protein DDB_G0287875 [Nematostella vectensis]
MIPLGESAGILPRVPTNGMMSGDFPLTIVKPSFVDFQTLQVSSPVNNNSRTQISIVHTRNQTRESSASSLRSFLRVCQNKKKVDVVEQKSNAFVTTATRARTTVRVRDGNNARNQEYGQIDEKRAASAIEAISLEHNRIKKSESSGCLESKSDPLIVENNKEDSHTVQVNTKNANAANKKLAKNITKRKKDRTKKQSKSGKTRKKSIKKTKTSVFDRLTLQDGTNQLNSSFTTLSSASSRHSSSSVIFNKPSGGILNISKIQASYMPVQRTNKNVIYLPKVPTKSIATQQKVPTNPPRKNIIENSPSVPSPRKELGWSMQDDGRVTFRRVYLSEMQSKMLGGAPSVPPGTPTEEQMKRVEYIPSLFDVKSQRLVKAKLEKIEIKMKITEEKQKEKAMKEEQKKIAVSMVQLRQRQREEIYALNKVMTQLENENFRKFMKEKEAEALSV